MVLGGLEDSLHGFPRLFTVISEHICFLLLVFLFLFALFSCRFRATWVNFSGKSGPKDQVALHYYYTSPSHLCTTHEVSKL